MYGAKQSTKLRLAEWYNKLRRLWHRRVRTT